MGKRAAPTLNPRCCIIALVGNGFGAASPVSNANDSIKREFTRRAPSALPAKTKQPSDRRRLRLQVIGENKFAVTFAGGIKGRFAPSTEMATQSDASMDRRFRLQRTYTVDNASVLAHGPSPKTKTLLALEHLPYLSGISHQF